MLHRKKRNIQSRIIRCTIFLTILPVVLLELLFSYLTYRSTVTHITERSGAYADQLAFFYQTEMEKAEQLAESLVSFSALSEYLQQDFSSREEEYVYYMDYVHPMLRGCDSIYHGAKIRVYHNNPSRNIYSFTLTNQMTELLEQTLHGTWSLQTDSFWYNGPIRYYSYESVLSYYRAVRDSKDPKTIRYIVSVHLSEESLRELLHASQDSQSIALVFNKEGTLLTGSSTALLGQENWGSLVPGREDGSITRLNSQRYLTIERLVDPLRIVYLVDQESVTRDLFQNVMQIAMIGTLLLAVSLALTIRTSGEIARGIVSLRDKMKGVTLETINITRQSDTILDTEDEVEQLNAVFTDMLAEIRSLLANIRDKDMQVKDEIIARQQADMEALQYQINPHYLFNTLEAIRMNLLIKNDYENAEIVKLFAESYRQQINMDTLFVTLFSEIDFVKKFIQIMNYRLRGTIAFETDVDVSAYYIRVPKLLLQPIVENAVTHGIEVSGQPGVIRLQAELDDTQLQITIHDNGIGMDETHLNELRHRVCTPDNKVSVGLPNVYKRIKLIYGSEASLNIFSQPGEGTRVVLRLPVFWEENGYVSGADR